MPHCILEITETLSEQLDGHAIMDDIHNVLVASGQFNADDIKIRLYSPAMALVGGNEKESVHVTLKLLSGRETKIKQHLSESLFNTLSEWLEGETAVLTVDVRDMDRDTYKK